MVEHKPKSVHSLVWGDIKYQVYIQTREVIDISISTKDSIPKQDKGNRTKLAARTLHLMLAPMRKETTSL